MTSDERLQQLISDVLDAGAPQQPPARLLPETLRAVRATRRWPRAYALLRERPLRVGTVLVAGAPALRMFILLLGLLLAATIGVVAGAALLFSPAPDPADLGTFVSTGSMAGYRECPTATTLQDGRVLVAGGWDEGNSVNAYDSAYGSWLGSWAAADSTEIYDPETRSFGSLGSLLHRYFAHTATLLADGRVLIVGGSGAGVDDPPIEQYAEIWDPRTGTSTPTGTPLFPVWGCSDLLDHSRLLADDRVLIESPFGAQIWDPSTGSFSPIGRVWDPQRPGGTAMSEGQPLAGTFLADGRVLTITPSGAEVYDLTTATAHAAGQLVVPRRYGYYTATLLSDGRVLVVGGEDDGRSPLAEAEIWDPATEQFAQTSPPLLPRSRHAAALLKDGQVLIVGSFGAPHNGGTRTAELFEPH